MRITKHLIDAKTGLVFVGGAIAALGIAIWFSLMTEVRMAESRIDEIAHLEAELHREIGYGGLIHNFKNYVLRGSENYRVSAERNHRRLGVILDELDGLVDAEARPYLDVVRATFDAYRDNLDVAAAARIRGEPVTRIDQLVKIDDSLAVHALGVRVRATHLALANKRDELREAQLNVFVALCIFLAALLSLLMLMAQGTRSRLRTLEARLRAGGREGPAAQPTNARSMT
jgi:hypothetical protein